MNASHASHARSSEEADMRLLRFRCGIESLPANAPAVLGAMALGRPLRFFAVWKLGGCIPSIVRRHFAALRHFCNRLGQKVECKMSARESVWRLTGGQRGIVTFGLCVVASEELAQFFKKSEISNFFGYF